MPKNKKPPKVNKQEYLEVATEEEWPLWSARKGIDKDDFFRIVDFYVLHSPCRVSSYSPKKLEQYGWKNPWNSSRFRDAFDHIPGFKENDNFWFHESKNHFLEMWEQMGIKVFPECAGKEYAVFTYAGESNPRMDLLHHIRNAFAHGRFAVRNIKKESYFYFEDVTEIRGIQGLFVVARICLRKTTLIGWIDFFERKVDSAKCLSSLCEE